MWQGLSETLRVSACDELSRATDSPTLSKLDLQPHVDFHVGRLLCRVHAGEHIGHLLFDSRGADAARDLDWHAGRRLPIDAARGAVTDLIGLFEVVAFHLHFDGVEL